MFVRAFRFCPARVGTDHQEIRLLRDIVGNPAPLLNDRFFGLLPSHASELSRKHKRFALQPLALAL